MAIWKALSNRVSVGKRGKMNRIKSRSSNSQGHGTHGTKDCVSNSSNPIVRSKSTVWCSYAGGRSGGATPKHTKELGAVAADICGVFSTLKD
jgi:hypothetical protein